MNLFTTHPNTAKAVQYLDDKRVNKMTAETAQILCTAINLHGGQAPYKSFSPNHPIVKWAAENAYNAMYVFNYFQDICQEYEIRFNKKHKSSELMPVIESLLDIIPEGNETTSQPICVADEVLAKNLDIHNSYIQHLEKKYAEDVVIPTWTNRDRPNPETFLSDLNDFTEEVKEYISSDEPTQEKPLSDEGVITLKELCKELGLEPQKARSYLRKAHKNLLSNMGKTRWEWTIEEAHNLNIYRFLKSKMPAIGSK